MADWPIKINLDAKVSTETADKLAGTLIDIISPVSQTTGLAGDYIAQRRKVLAVVFEKGLEQARESGAKISPPPPKFLLEFADKASREELESELIDLWAAILAASVTDYDASLMTFADILSRIGPREANALRTLVGNFLVNKGRTEDLELARTMGYDDYTQIIKYGAQTESGAKEILVQLFEKKAAYWPRRVIRAAVHYKEGGMADESDFFRDYGLELQILRREGLVDFVRRDLFEYLEGSAPFTAIRVPNRIETVDISPLGLEFSRRCQAGSR